MTRIKVTKLEAARRLTDAAIRMFFRNEDPVAIYLLAASSVQVLKDLASKQDARNVEQVVNECFGEIFPAEVQDILWKKIREFAGFLKHADRDPEKIYDGPEEEANAWVLFLASLFYRADLGRPPTPEMSVLIAWLSALNPGAPESVLKGVNPAVVKAFPDSIRTLPRGKQLAIGLEVLRMARSASL